jgi:hypothetical protein
MRSRLFSISVLIAMLAATTLSRASQPADPNNTPDAAVTGIWRCQMEGLPAVTLTVTDECGSLTGAVLFYLHRREPGQPVTATPGVPEPLFHPSFDGKTFTFQVSHRRTHPPETLNDAPVTFQLKLDGAEKAQLLMNESENDPNAPVYILEKSAY